MLGIPGGRAAVVSVVVESGGALPDDGAACGVYKLGACWEGCNGCCGGGCCCCWDCAFPNTGTGPVCIPMKALAALP